MNIIDKTRLLQTSMLTGLMMSLGGIAYAQTSDPISTTAESISEVEDDFEAEDDEIVVTGSRIRRNEFTSTSPLQVLDGETISEAGFLDLGDALRTTSVVQGVQLDGQFNSTFVSEAGPGGQSVALRGLGPGRTLILINGRRYAPAGIEGAPSFPDISLIPTSAIDRNDILLDGASSVYGSDAVAGVINVILKTDYEGLEVGGQYNAPVTGSGGGESYSLDFIAGTAGDKGSFMVSGEYFHQDELRGNQRDWMCDVIAADDFSDLEGQQFCHSRDINRRTVNGTLTEVEELGRGTLFQQFLIASGSTRDLLLPRPGTDNPAYGQVENFELASLGGNFNGLYTPSAFLNQDVQITPNFERFTFFTAGNVNLDNLIEGTEFFTEFNIANRKNNFESAQARLQFTLPDDNPYIDLSGFRYDRGTGPIPNSPFVVAPLNPIRGGLETELTQYRLMAGFRGDLNFLGNSFLNDWDYEIFGGYTRSQGYSARNVVLEEKLIRSINAEIDPATGRVRCQAALNPGDAFFGGSEDLEPCVPLNPFFLGLYGNTNPQFENQATFDYLAGQRTSTTFVDESIAGGYITGDLFDVPAGTVKAVFGGEWRQDSIDTRSDDVTQRGLGRGFFRDLPSNGTVSLWEAFGELNIPVFDDTAVGSFELDLAGRYINHEFYGSNETYAVKARWDITDFFTVKGTYGTSFRAPNLRDLFLEGQSSFQDITDPCQVPRLAQSDTDNDGVLDAYTPGADDDGDGIGDLDGRAQVVINNCQTLGIDPFSQGIGINFGDSEVFDAGNTGLDPETSKSFTIGATLDQPWTDAFDLQIGATYFKIDIKDAIFDPSANFLVGSCYNATSFPNNAFCTRQARDGNTQNLSEIDVTPFNIGSEISEGIDFNARAGKEFTAFGQNLDFTTSMQATRTLEDSTTITLGNDITFIDEAGEITSPDWRGNAQQRLAIGDNLSLFWNVRWIGKGEQQDRDGQQSSNCQPVAATDTQPAFGRREGCYNTDDVFYHDVSASYAVDDWAFRVGLQNALNKNPPQIDDSTGHGVSIDSRGVPVGVGYDRNGRTLFMNVSKKF